MIRVDTSLGIGKGEGRSKSVACIPDAVSRGSGRDGRGKLPVGGIMTWFAICAITTPIFNLGCPLPKN